ncbi:MAG: type II toxin-antitoxin system VapB family antitoxin [Trueperaceae bacterium]
MALNIKNDEAHRLAQELAKSTGRSITQVVTDALREAHSKNQRKRTAEIESVVSQLDAIAEHYTKLPTLDDRPADEILGYNENGLPG